MAVTNPASAAPSTGAVVNEVYGVGGNSGGTLKNDSFVDSGTASVNHSITGTAVVKSHGKPALTLSPGRIDPTNPVWTSGRKPLVGQFRFGGRDVFVIANHFNSKGGDQSADGRFQYPEESSTVQRSGQAQALHSFVTKLLAVDKKAQFVAAGDLNDFQFSKALAVVRTGTADGSGPSILTDLISTLPLNQQYTYVFNGVSQVLDHILVSNSVRGLNYQVEHVNSEFASQASDHDPQVADITP